MNSRENIIAVEESKLVTHSQTLVLRRDVLHFVLGETETGGKKVKVLRLMVQMA